ncbi:SRPBCC family protein [Azospirillum sp. B506]|uniref:SRPBCC family protein n=1 Tax=Azospirillum sp. B506 TaxID=137721 RepID=UPI0006791C45|nr:SRPBCC family protein [Azospirillum sp. B506]
MPLVTATTLLPVPARRVWPLVRWDGAVGDWYPGAISMTVDGAGKGALRLLRLYDGTPVVHRLEHVSQVDDAYTYTVIEGPYPVADLLAQLRLRPDGEGQAELHWTATFHRLRCTELEAERFVRDLYDAGMARLRGLLHS